MGFIKRYIIRLIEHILSERLDKTLADLQASTKTAVDASAELLTTFQKYAMSNQLLIEMLSRQQIWILAYYRLFIAHDPSLINAYNRDVFISSVKLLLQTRDLVQTDDTRLEIQKRLSALRGSAENNERDEWFITAEQEYQKEKGMT